MKKIAAAVVLVFVLAVWYRWYSVPDVDDLLQLSAQRGTAALKARRDYSDWQPPVGAYDLTIALDRSGSIVEADRALGRAMVDSAAAWVTGKNRLHLAGFANAFETFGQAEGEDGIKELLGRWHRSSQYKEDRLYTNLTMTLYHLLQRAVPIVKQGYLAEIIVVTDGDNDPPPEQNEAEFQAGIDEALRAVDYEHQDRLRIHVLEVGEKFAHRGKVANDFLKGRAATIQTKDWSAVLAIVERLQSALQGSFSIASANTWPLRISVPEEDPQELGPFTLKLTGPPSAKFQARLEPADATVGDKVTGWLKINQGRPLAFNDPSLELKAADRIVFEFKTDPAEPLEPGWQKYFSSRLWRGQEWLFTASLEPRENILPLIDLGGRRQFTVYADSLLFSDGLRALFWAGVLAAIVLVAVIFLLYRSSGKEEKKEQAEAAAQSVASGLVGTVEYDGQQVRLFGPEQTVNDCLLFSRSGEDICVMPYVTCTMRVGHRPLETYFPDVVYVLPNADEVLLIEKAGKTEYRVVLRAALSVQSPNQEVAVA